MADRMTPAARSRLMSRIRRSGTLPERVLAAALARLGLVPDSRDDRSLPGSPDLVFRAARVAVLVHGCFWHRCPRCARRPPATNAAFWAAKLSANVARDRRVLAALRRAGWSAVVLWECAIAGDPDAAARAVADAVRMRSRPSTTGRFVRVSVRRPR